ncbi:MAG UNVERIFIED_CONTAM: hypothetical protein LVR18_46135 [Planctomycetaceae bacterium]
MREVTLEGRTVLFIENPRRHRDAATSLSDHQSVGWRKDRETGEGGITVAGLLMFGQMVSIQDEFPNYMLDYQERPDYKNGTAMD